CFLFEIQGTQMQVTASDKDTTLKTSIELLEANGDCKFALDAKQIMDILKEMPEQPLTLDINSSTLQIELCYQNGKFMFQGESGDEYPMQKVAEGESHQIVIGATELTKGLSTAITAAASDESRKVMNGIFMDITPEDLSVVASDGHKLVRYRIMCDTQGITTQFTLPQKPAVILKIILDKEKNNITIQTVDNKYAIIKIDNYEISCRLIEEKYPNYKIVIPQHNDSVATIDRASFISAMRRVLVVADKTTALIKFQFELNQVTLTSENVNYALSGEEKLVCQYQGAPLKIGFKGTDLLELINNLQGNDLILKLSDPSRAGLILPSQQEKNTDMLMLLMPLLINN
ncbi:MAG: DNA polymerase III subunit beta, partial [Bacteroidaceae bacterium]|nr:DNA polymerase III subunit beta [Bacteroidaceae bacterium]